jgi:hypothetical protein
VTDRTPEKNARERTATFTRSLKKKNKKEKKTSSKSRHFLKFGSCWVFTFLQTTVQRQQYDTACSKFTLFTLYSLSPYAIEPEVREPSSRDSGPGQFLTPKCCLSSRLSVSDPCGAAMIAIVQVQSSKVSATPNRRQLRAFQKVKSGTLASYCRSQVGVLGHRAHHYRLLRP